MLKRPPHYQLARVYDDGRVEPAEILPVLRLPLATRTGRRGLLGAGLSAAGALALMTGCGHSGTPSTSGAETSTPAAGLMRMPDGDPPRAHNAAISALTVTPDGSIVATGALGDPEVKLWGVADGVRTAGISGQTGGVTALTVARDGRMLVVGTGDGAVRLWRLPDRTWQIDLRKSGTYINALAITPDGSTLVAGLGDETIALWALGPGMPRPLANLGGHSGAVRALAVTPDGRLLLSGSIDGTVRVWALPDGTATTTLRGHGGVVTALAVTPDGRTLVSGSLDSSARLWSLPDYASITSLTMSYRVTAAAITHDGRTLAVGLGSGDIELWALPDGKRSSVLKGRLALGVTALAVTPDERTLVAGYEGGVVALWNLQPPGFRAFLFDPAATPDTVRGIAYTVQGLTYTQPCGSPLPAGAACTCNCVPGAYRAPAAGPVGGGGGSYCTCNKVCYCVPIV